MRKINTQRWLNIILEINKLKKSKIIVIIYYRIILLFTLYEKGLINMIKIEEKYDFNSIDKKIMEANSNIERNIDRFSADDRGFLSQNL